MSELVRKVAIYIWHTAVCLAVLACALTIFWGFSYARSVHQRRHAEQLLLALRTIQVGAGGYEKMQQVAKEFGGARHCSGDSCNYDFEYSFAFSKSWLVQLRRTEWDSFGLRPWRVNAAIGTKNSEVTYLEFSALIGRGRGWLYSESPFAGNMWGWLAVSAAINSDRFEQYAKLENEYAQENAIPPGHQIEADRSGVIVKKPSLEIEGGGEALSVYLLPSASIQNRAASNINLRCATGMLPCTELCQVAPVAWNIYSQYQKSNGWAVDEPSNCANP
jgi:hypothetical protein